MKAGGDRGFDSFIKGILHDKPKPHHQKQVAQEQPAIK
jgi:hypothetical protein